MGKPSGKKKKHYKPRESNSKAVKEEIGEGVKNVVSQKGIEISNNGFASASESVESRSQLSKGKVDKGKKSKKAVDKAVLDEKGNYVKEEEVMRTVKLVFGEDIRWAQLPANCNIQQLREIVWNRFPSLKAVLIKYKDQEGDLVTITTTEELRWAEESADPQGSVRLYVVEINPKLEPILFKEAENTIKMQNLELNRNNGSNNGKTSQGDENNCSSYIDEWIVHFAQLFKNQIGFNSDTNLDFHQLGMKLYTETMEDVTTSEEAQDHLETASEKFQEMAALALLNWGNVHMSRARKRAFLAEDASREASIEQVKTAFEWAKGEYMKAGKRYEEALKIKPDFYEAVLAMGQQWFELAKLYWYCAVGSKVDLETQPSSSEVFELFKNAEDCMERGTQMWEEMDEQSLQELSKLGNEKTELQKMGLDVSFKDISTDEAAEHAANMRLQINLLWGIMLYERSVVEFKLKFTSWEEHFKAALENFKLAGASLEDIAVMIKNHSSNATAQEGLDFKIDGTVQSWNEMYDAKWLIGVSSFRLEPLFRRQVP
eukprot:TRINITY_DN21930_c0_g1_i1.p1 TRINITY_DN21930_c0_g1~~TRINITY_DN21930_c0_g1_i1.p1  ORF type:complete len:544 (+),score=130.73 TRINITY_DN21930_c0_g1_i1:253-1884(+)